MDKKKVVVIGLDCASPELVFDRWLDKLPNLKKLVNSGIHGPIESSTPPIPVPAWTTFATSRNPGQLGFFGFRNRRDFSYTDMLIANSTAVREPTVWQILSAAGKKVGILGVPQTYPPKPVNGFLVTSFLTPDTSCRYTYPDELKGEIQGLVGDYMLDCENFRTEDKKELLDQVYKMTEQRFKLATHYLGKGDLDFFMMVEMGPDRLHHALWKFFDESHRKYEYHPEYTGAIEQYYIYLDARIGELLPLVQEEAHVIVVSDHGVKRMDGCININDWFIKEGYLKLKSKPEGVVRLRNVEVDWENTVAWGWGGYYSRVFLNVKGREPHGTIDPAEYERVRDELAERIMGIPDDKGNRMGTRALKPQDIYTGDHVDEAPDLLAFFGDLSWRVTEDIGHDSVYGFETELGPDDAVHAQHGMFILSDGATAEPRRVDDLRLVDGAPTILSLMGLPVPDDMEGKVLSVR
jgi:predicted AlkP superfamily phosphohydrolase/phosphomutase